MLIIFAFLCAIGTLLHFIFNIQIWIIAAAIIFIMIIITVSKTNTGRRTTNLDGGCDFGGSND